MDSFSPYSCLLSIRNYKVIGRVDSATPQRCFARHIVRRQILRAPQIGPMADEAHQLADDLPAKLGLVRQTSSMERKLKCCICLEQQAKGIECLGHRDVETGEERHFLCTDCFSPYVCSLCDEGSRLLESNGEVRCD
jgi:hypothetical protein